MRVHVLNHGDVTGDNRFPDRNPDNPMYAFRILAEGDSWFTFGAVPGSNVLFNIECSKPSALVTIAFPGDTIVHMGDPRHALQLRRFLADHRFAYKWDAILLSGGGNDLIDEAATLLPPRGVTGNVASEYVDAGQMQRLMGDVQSAYRNIVNIRDQAGSPNKGAPIFAHTYDYPTPRMSPARFLGVVGLRGPWLFPAFSDAKIPEAMWKPVCDFLVDQMAAAIAALDSDAGSQPLPNFHVVDTRNTLIRAELGAIGSSGDWANEIHPNTSGYQKIAAKISAKMKL